MTILWLFTYDWIVSRNWQKLKEASHIVFTFMLHIVMSENIDFIFSLSCLIYLELTSNIMDQTSKKSQTVYLPVKKLAQVCWLCGECQQPLDMEIKKTWTYWVPYTKLHYILYLARATFKSFIQFNLANRHRG